MTREREAVSVSTTSSRGETMVIKKAIQQRLDSLKDITSQSVDKETDLEKLKSLQTLRSLESRRLSWS